MWCDECIGSKLRVAAIEFFFVACFGHRGQVANYEGVIPQEVTIEDKSMVERVKLIEQLNEEDKKTIFSIIDKMLTNKKFKDFFNKNVAAL